MSAPAFTLLRRPLPPLREAITLAVHLVVHLARVNGRRTVTQVAHVRGYDAEQDRFVVEPWLPEVATQEGATA